jgi:hypothetical protein
MQSSMCLQLVAPLLHQPWQAGEVLVCYLHRAQQEDERAEARAAADGVEAAREEAATARKQLEERVAADLAGDAEAVQLQAKLKVHLSTVRSRGVSGGYKPTNDTSSARASCHIGAAASLTRMQLCDCMHDLLHWPRQEADTQLRAARLREAEQEAQLEVAQDQAKQSAEQATQLQQVVHQAA